MLKLCLEHAGSHGIIFPTLQIGLDTRSYKEGIQVISHAHADHIPYATEKPILATPATIDLMKARGFKGETQALSFFESFETENTVITLFPAGHIFGSSMVFIESDWGNVLYTGDFRFPASPTSEGCVFPDKRVDIFITEATFGLPIYRWKPYHELETQIISFAQQALAQEETPVFLAYNLGKGQEVMSILAKAGIPMHIHEGGFELSKIYTNYGFDLGQFEKLNPATVQGKAVIMPSNVTESAKSLKIPRKKLAYVSGWATLEARMQQMTIDARIPLSDHSDFYSILKTVAHLQPKKVLVTHSPNPEIVCYYLQTMGFDASPLQLEQEVDCRNPVSIERPNHHFLDKKTTIQTLKYEQSSFYTFSNVLQTIADTRSINEKIETTRNYLCSLSSLEDRKFAVRYLGEGAFASVEEKRLGIGHTTIAHAAADFLEVDYELVFKACKTATGSSSESVEKLMENWPVGFQKRSPHVISLQEINQFFCELAEIKSKEQRIALMHECWKKLTPIEIKYLIRIMHQYSLRIGFEEKNILKVIAKLYNKPIDEVRYVHMLTLSLEKTLEKCHQDQTDSVQFSYFKPLAFMLASPLHQVKQWAFQEYVCEEKLDGMRCQAHIKDGKVILFSRDMNDVTTSFPELNDFFINRGINEVILDGEICVFKNDTILPFQLLQKRMGVKKPSKKLLEEFPVRFIAYDILAQNKELLLELSFEKRREKLESFARIVQLPISLVYSLESENDINTRFIIAKAHGNEGLMLKKKSSLYEFGQRGNAWIKVKEPAGSLDTVILYAHAGSGKRGGLYSDFTLAVRNGVKEDGTPFFVPIGKAYGGFTDAELKRLNSEIRGLITDRFGPTVGLKPKIVVELEFEEIQENKRTKAGFTLRLPRFKAIRWDLSIHDTDSLEDVKALYEAQLNRERLPNSENPFLQIPT